MKTNLDLGIIKGMLQEYGECKGKLLIHDYVKEHTSSIYFINKYSSINKYYIRDSYVEIDRVGYTSHAKGDTVEKYVYVVTSLYNGDGTYLDYADVILSKDDFSDMFLTRQDTIDTISLVITRALSIITNRLYRKEGDSIWLEK